MYIASTVEKCCQDVWPVSHIQIYMYKNCKRKDEIPKATSLNDVLGKIFQAI